MPSIPNACRASAVGPKSVIGMNFVAGRAADAAALTWASLDSAGPDQRQRERKRSSRTHKFRGVTRWRLRSCRVPLWGRRFADPQASHEPSRRQSSNLKGLQGAPAFLESSATPFELMPAGRAPSQCPPSTQGAPAAMRASASAGSSSSASHRRIGLRCSTRPGSSRTPKRRAAPLAL